MSTPVTICNLALSAVPAARIVTLDENSLAAKECRLHYPQVLGEVLQEADWGFGTVRLPLAAVANDRAAEWSFAYAAPPDMAFPLAILDIAGQRQDFVFSGTTIYVNCVQPSAEYVPVTTLASQGNALFTRYLIAQLAARLCVPITKDLKRAASLAQIAEVARERAMAANFNREPHRYDQYVPDVVADRMGIDTRHIHRPPPYVTDYPAEDYVSVFEESLD